MNKKLQILDIKSVTVNTELFNVTAINRESDPYWVEFIKPHFDEINVGIEILPIDKIDKTKKWFINVDVNAWNWPDYPTDIFESFGTLLINELNNGNAYLILNLQCESFTEEFYRLLYKKLESHPSIPYNKIVYMVAATDAKLEYEKFVKDYSIPKNKQIDIIYAHHVYKRFKHDNSLSFFNYDRTVKKEKKFLSLNRRWHDHRLLLVCSLAQQNLLEHGYVSLGVMPNEINSAQNQIDNIFRTRVDFNLLQDGFNKIKNQLPLQIDPVDLSINHFQTTSLPIEFYQKSYFSLVSSTRGFSWQEPSVGFTEKEVKPIVAKHPFIIHNLPGVLKNLKSMGFLTFEPWFDESYDNEVNDWERMNKIVKEVKRLSELSNDTWDRMLDEMEPVLEHNYNRMVNYTSEHCYFNSDLKKLLYYVS
jgi:hypothetical protein